jgi:dihydropteroate synthase
MGDASNLILKRMGVVNITPNSFSDGGEIQSPEAFLARVTAFGQIDALDLGAESTAPMNAAISWQEEWERLLPVLPLLGMLDCQLSLDSYHPETVFKLMEQWPGPLIWNDVSGKFDHAVLEFLKRPTNTYVFCHNRAPTREQTGSHMQFTSSEGNILQELQDHFLPHAHPQVIFDPCLGFSKSYAENWEILERLGELQARVPHQRWLIGFSRKSFLRQKFSLELEQREQLDQVHLEELRRLIPVLSGEVWVRTHRPDLLSNL